MMEFLLLVCPILIALGIVMLLYPRSFYELTESWKHEGSSDPSDLFIFSTRFGGIMFVLAGISGLVIALLSFFNVV